MKRLIPVMLLALSATANAKLYTRMDHADLAQQRAAEAMQDRRNDFFQRMGCPMEGIVKSESRRDGTIVTLFIRGRKVEISGKEFPIEEPGIHEFYIPLPKKGSKIDPEGVRILRAPAPGEDPCDEYRDIQP